jgi:hypothetical protein
MNAFTKPVWIAVGTRVECVDDKAPDIANCTPESMGQEGRSNSESCANARLISTSPEMHKLLARLLKENTAFKKTFGVEFFPPGAKAAAREIIKFVKGNGK